MQDIIFDRTAVDRSKIQDPRSKIQDPRFNGCVGYWYQGVPVPGSLLESSRLSVEVDLIGMCLVNTRIGYPEKSLESNKRNKLVRSKISWAFSGIFHHAPTPCSY
eukprot:scaffold184657_cov54-Attheya_sp.AAC.1